MHLPARVQDNVPSSLYRNVHRRIRTVQLFQTLQ
jgi:hypothetical protein